MIRFANPGSDISMIMKIYQQVFNSLKDFSFFELDDVTRVLTRYKMASSSGYTGDKALELSTRKDRSRDPLYNQAKSYCEIFRLLGLITSLPEDALKYKFTYFGINIGKAKVIEKKIISELLLGIVFPNEVLDSKGKEQSRVFKEILKLAFYADKKITRDEIILFVLSENDDESIFKSKIEKIKKMRGNVKNIKEEMNLLSDKLGIQINTLQNYTRFIISSLKYTEWFVDGLDNTLYRGSKNLKVLKLTEVGEKIYKEISCLDDIRLKDEISEKTIMDGFFSTLARMRFDVRDVKFNEVLFSPYQTLKSDEVNEVLKYVEKETEKMKHEEKIPVSKEESVVSKKIIKTIDKIRKKHVVTTDIGKEIQDLILKKKSCNQIIQIVLEETKMYSKNDFYSLIGDIFNELQLNCEVSRSGVNYSRWDAIIINDYSIPIEIKSPSEEQHISIKAIRQAVENKIVLLSRKTHKTDIKTPSFAVGYLEPNSRAEVEKLISYIYSAYGFRIAVICLESLIKILYEFLENNKSVDFWSLEGIISVEDIQTD